MLDSIVGIVAVAIGLFLIVFHKGFARLCAFDQYRLWMIKYNKTAIRFAEIMGFIAGIGFVAFGILFLCGIAKMN